MVVYKNFEKSGAPGYPLTTHGYEAWKSDHGISDADAPPYLEWARMQTERNNLFNGIWKMIVRLNTEDLRRVYAFVRTLLR
jgi:hypothetical protein